MKFKKADWVICRDAENEGKMVAMTSIVYSKRTELNESLSKYFRSKMPNYDGIFDEYTSEDILYSINEFIEEKDLDIQRFDFPFSSDTVIRLLPINNNIQLKVLIVDEYYGDGEYSKYVDIRYFLINEDTTEKDVDELIDFICKYIK